MNRILQRASVNDAQKFIYELCWREYFQRIWFEQGNRIFSDFNNAQQPVKHHQMIKSVADATTGIEAIDQGIQELYSTGYMHNHVRMYVASIVTNVGQVHWHNPSKWMYYHLLDGDLASNSLSWQWVAGTFSSKKYFCNQDNINTYGNTTQRDTFLDQSYEAVMRMNVPEVLQPVISPDLTTILPVVNSPLFDYNLPLLLYNSCNLDPLWRNEEPANRLLILEPSYFNHYPVSANVMDFILSLAYQINGLQIYIGEVNDIPALAAFPEILSKEHPAFRHYPGIKDEPEWLFPSVNRVKGSFTSFWKACEKNLMQKHTP
jgi:deoxyribodipyrimidine photo-lyase